jgi:hypothetical protein
VLTRVLKGAGMAGRRPLKGHAPRLLGNHSGAEGKRYRALYDALEAELGPFSVLQRFEAGRVAAAGVELQAATAALNAARRDRRLGRGRRPNLQAIERLARRAGLADGSYSAALERLKELCAKKNGHRAPTSGAELLERLAQERPR